MDVSKRLPLKVYETAGVGRVAWPITQGIPFADGQLRRGAQVSVIDGTGTPLPTQATCLATWNKECAWVKWLLIDFQCDLAAGETKELFVEYGQGVEPPPPTLPVSVARHNRRTRIDTGKLRLELRHNSPDFLAACCVLSADGWRNILRGGPGPHLYLSETDGTVYDSVSAAPSSRLAVEDEGPLRASVAIKGYHATFQGIHLCPYTLRIHLYAGKRRGLPNRPSPQASTNRPSIPSYK